MFRTTRIVRGFDAIRPLFDAIGSNGFICGGYARYCASPCLDPAPATDVDVYCYTVADYDVLLDKLSLFLPERKESPRAVSFSRATEGALAYGPQVQLIKPVSKFRMVTLGSKEEVISNFDFTVVRAAILDRNTALVDEDFLRDEEDQVLRLRNIHCPISSTLRCLKYAKRGYRLNPIDVLPLFLDWDARDQSYRDELIQGLRELQAAIDAERKLSDERLTAIYDLMNVD